MQAAKRIADVCFTQESEKMQLILSFQLPDLSAELRGGPGAWEDGVL